MFLYIKVSFYFADVCAQLFLYIKVSFYFADVPNYSVFLVTKSIFHLRKRKQIVKEYFCNKHTSNLSRIPRVYPCKFFLAGVNFYRFKAYSTDFTRKVAFFTDLTRKIGVFRCKFYSPKILLV